MSTHRYFDRICVAVILITLVITILFMNGEKLGITMVVDAVNPWYGSDKSFRHELSVRPGNGVNFQYVSNRVLEADSTMLPGQKLSAMLNVERAKTPY